MLSSYRSVLSVPGAPRLLGSALFGRLPQGMTPLATLLLVRDSTHSYAAAGLAVGGQALMSALAAPVLGRGIDRRGRDLVLVRCALGYALALWLLVAAAQAGAGAVVLVAVAAAGGGLLPPIGPSLRALMRAVFDPRLRERAYALESVAQELIWITGPLLVAGVIAVASPAAALVLVGAQCAIGTTLFVRAPLARAGSRGTARVDGAAAALASRALRTLLPAIALTGAALGATEVGLPALALHAGSGADAGLLLALWSAGSMTGGLWYGSRRWHASLPSRYALLLVLAVACTAPLILARSLETGVVFSFLAGITIAPAFSCQYALVGHAVQPGAETEAFTWVSAALIAGVAAGSAAAGMVVAAAGFPAAFVLACAVGALAAATALTLRVRGDVAVAR